MSAFFEQSIEVQGCDDSECFPLTCFLLSNRTIVQCNPSQQLHIELPHAQYSTGCFSYRGKHFWQKFMQNLLICFVCLSFSVDYFFEFFGLCSKLGIGKFTD